MRPSQGCHLDTARVSPDRPPANAYDNWFAARITVFACECGFALLRREVGTQVARSQQRGRYPLRVSSPDFGTSVMFDHLPLSWRSQSVFPAILTSLQPGLALVCHLKHNLAPSSTLHVPDSRAPVLMFASTTPPAKNSIRLVTPGPVLPESSGFQLKV
jgi:hypothetical protein